MIDGADFASLVASKLARSDVEETLFFGQYVGRARPAVSFEEHLAEEFADLERRIQLKSWQHGFTAARARTEAERAGEDARFLHAQAWRQEMVSAARWRAFLDCFDRPAGWIAFARALEDDGHVVEASAALAAARWLDDGGTRDAIAAHLAQRRSGLPARLVAQPEPTFRALPFAERHWRAWDMKNYALLDLPSLLAFESDESFSVRARVSRSLGQRPHPASIQALQEATLDPHPFARAQAARSLGWCADPTATSHLASLASADPHPMVRRAAEKARQRIIGYWMHFGEWAAIMASPATTCEVARSLVEQGLPYLARDVLARSEADEDPGIEALLTTLDGLDREDERDAAELRYGFWFASARQEETSIRGAADSDAALAEALAHGDMASRARALLIVSAQARIALRPEVEALTGAPDAVGWGARRAMRCMGWGSMSQRHARAAG